MKKIIYIIFIVFLQFIFINTINAGSLSINGSTSVYVGNTIQVSVNFNNIAGRFKITSSDQSILSGGNEDFYDNQTSTFTFTAKAVGTATITVTPIGAVGDYDNDVYTGGSRSLTINVVKKYVPPAVDVNKVYSKNNYLSSLEIEGYELNPSFDKDTLEYSVILEPGLEKININTIKEHSKASVKGDGEISLTEGVNTIEIIVTAENGNERVYKISATVYEKDPINVKINKENYTVVKRKELIERLNGYIEKTVKINDFDIPALYNEVTHITLVGLKDKEGNIDLYSYDSKKGEYSEYKEFTFDIMNLYIHEAKNANYEKINIKINDISVPAYKLDGLKDYYLLYATNTITGNEGYYLYDKLENSVQRYDDTLIENVVREKDKYLSIVLVLSSVCFLTMLFLLIEVNRDNKRKNEE